MAIVPNLIRKSVRVGRFFEEKNLSIELHFISSKARKLSTWKIFNSKFAAIF
jgi:hypothetical protein